jgi:hypothetical protein
MKCVRSILLALLAIPLALPVSGASVDVSSAETVLVRTGDTLAFELFTWNYTLNAQSFGVPLYPTDVTFAFVTAPANSAAQFAATLSLPDASNTVAFDGPLGFTAGYFSGADFQGAVSTLTAHLHLSSTVSQDLFGGGSVWLSLENTGDDVTLGLSPLTFRQDLFFTLSGGPLSVGAVPGAVMLESLSASQFEFAGEFALINTVPEPGSGLLLAAGVGLLYGVSALLKRFPRRRP